MAFFDRLITFGLGMMVGHLLAKHSKAIAKYEAALQDRGGADDLTEMAVRASPVSAVVGKTDFRDVVSDVLTEPDVDSLQTLGDCYATAKRKTDIIGRKVGEYLQTHQTETAARIDNDFQQAKEALFSVFISAVENDPSVRAALGSIQSTTRDLKTEADAMKQATATIESLNSAISLINAVAGLFTPQPQAVGTT